MPEFDIVLTDTPTDADEAIIDDGLADFNAEYSDYHDKRALAVLARDPATGQTLGGMVGRTSLGLLFIDLVYLPKTLRGQDLGSRLLGMMEQEAVRRGCRSATVMTISFQAPGFYQRHGWREFGRVPCDPPGTFRVFMSKELPGAEGV
jgi:GNAT superfamily N-acetyltransferase